MVVTTMIINAMPESSSYFFDVVSIIFMVFSMVKEVLLVFEFRLVFYCKFRSKLDTHVNTPCFFWEKLFETIFEGF